MLLKLRQRMAQDESGFTLVELLVVMLILGLLAAIAIPAFFNQRDKARDAEAKSYARTAETAARDVRDRQQRFVRRRRRRRPVANLQNIEATLNGATLDAVGSRPPTPTRSGRVGCRDHVQYRRARGRHHLLTCATGGEAGCPSNGGDWD